MDNMNMTDALSPGQPTLTFHEPSPGYVLSIHAGDAEEGSAAGTPLTPMTPEELRLMDAAGHHF